MFPKLVREVLWCSKCHICREFCYSTNTIGAEFCFEEGFFRATSVGEGCFTGELGYHRVMGGGSVYGGGLGAITGILTPLWCHRTIMGHSQKKNSVSGTCPWLLGHLTGHLKCHPFFTHMCELHKIQMVTWVSSLSTDRK